jgi:hypothetical protein
MKQMINDYRKGLEMLQNRLNELSLLRKDLAANGHEAEIAALDLDRRINLLKTESVQTQEIISHLSSVVRRRDLSVKT